MEVCVDKKLDNLIMSGRSLVKLEDFERFIKNSFGLGQGTHYTPWIRLSYFPSDSTSAFTKSITVGREHQTLSL